MKTPNGDMTSTNMFAYCGNNPVNSADPSGQFWLTAIIVTAVVVTVAHVVASVTINKSQLHPAEKEVAKKHYIGAFKAKQSAKISDQYTDKEYGTNAHTQDDTKANAYRHAMWNAVMTDKMGSKKAKKFADAHEIFDDPDGIWKENSEMDLYNNQLGRSIAEKYSGQGYDVFSQKIIEAIENGEAVVIKWD